MSYNYTLKYRTYDQLLADCASDFKKYQLQDILDPQDFIKVAKRVNYDLGLRVHQTKERILEVEKHKVKLPNDFYILDFALVITDYETKQYKPQGTNIEERVIGKLAQEYQQTPSEVINLCDEGVINTECDPTDPCGNCYDPSAACPQCGRPMTNGICNPCCAHPDSCSLTCNGDVVQLVQKLTYETRYYKRVEPLRITGNAEDFDGVCPNLYWESPLTAVIKAGWLHTSFETGKIYLNYQGHLEDEEGNLLVVDHDMINEYYEYAVKQRIIENLIMNDEEVNPQKMQLIEGRYREARKNAKSIVNTPNFAELRELFKANRNAQYSKYYDMFASRPRLSIR